MQRFPIDAPRRRVIRTFDALGFQVVREREHLAMERVNCDGSRTSLSLPNHHHIKGSTLRWISTLADIRREMFLHACEAQ